MIGRGAVCGIVLFALDVLVSGQSAERPQPTAQADRVSQRIRALQSEADRLAGESRTLLGDLRKLEVEQQLQVERVKEARAAVARGQAAIQQSTARLEWLEQQRVAQLPDLRAQLVDIYKRGRSGYAKVLFDGSTIRDFRRAARAVAAIVRINEQRVVEHRGTLDASRRERAQLEEELRGLVAAEATALGAQAAAGRAVAERAALVAQIDTRRDLNAQFAGELQLAYERLQQQVANVTAGSAIEPVVLPLVPFRGALDWPVQGRLAARFGQPSGRPGDSTTRNGVEIAAPDETPVHAIHPGTISYAGPFTAFGNLVIVDHGRNTYSLYGYLASMGVTAGAFVDGGTELGRVGSAPAGAPTLYFELRIDGRSVDPVDGCGPDDDGPLTGCGSSPPTAATNRQTGLGAEMASRSRVFVLALSTLIMVFAFVGGYLGQAVAKDDTYQHLRVFEDVVSLVLNNYVEPVDVSQAMKGAMKGLADSLDPESAYLSPDLVRSLESNDPGGAAEVGVDLTRQYYLRVVAVRDGSPAAKAGLRPADFIRAIDSRPTRDMSAYEGARRLRGAPGSKVALLVIRGNAADPHELALVRERIAAPDVSSRMANANTGYVRVAEFAKDSSTKLKEAIDGLTKTGATRFIIDVRSTARGDLDDAIAAARLFVKTGTLIVRLTRGDMREPISSSAGDGAVAAPLALLVDQGTAGPAEVFAAALAENDRADLVGIHTLGRAARQRLIKLPDQSGLWLTYVRYLTPDNDPIHETGLEPDVEVDLPEIEFGSQPPGPDATLQRAIEHLADKK